MDADTKRKLNIYANQVGLLTDELSHLQQDQSLKEWEIKELNEKNKQLTHKVDMLTRDLKYEKGRFAAIEEEYNALSQNLEQTIISKKSIALELAQLKREKRIISNRIQQSYREVSERRKLSIDDVPFNNSDVEEYQEEISLPTNLRVKSRSSSDLQVHEVKDYKETTSYNENSSIEFISDSSDLELEDIQSIGYNDETNSPTLNTSLLGQYEQLICELQKENQKLIDLNSVLKQKSRKPKAITFFAVRRWNLSTLRPYHVLLWQHWSLNLPRHKLCASHAMFETD